MWETFGTRVALATTHHPQSNGLTERINRTLISMIRKYTQATGSRWAELLPFFEFAYNRSKHAQTRTTPFSTVYGHDPPVPIELLLNKTSTPQAKDPESYAAATVRQLGPIWALVQEQNQRAQQRISEQENQHRGQPRYYPGDEVLVYWPHFAPRSSLVRKQRLRYEGPFVVEKVVSEQVVQLFGLPAKMSPLINVEYIHLYRRSRHPALQAARGIRGIDDSRSNFAST